MVLHIRFIRDTLRINLRVGVIYLNDNVIVAQFQIVYIKMNSFSFLPISLSILLSLCLMLETLIL